jgi:hypothetical protein
MQTSKRTLLWVSLLLLLLALRTWLYAGGHAPRPQEPWFWSLVVAGFASGLVGSVCGVAGGSMLAPLLYFLGWPWLVAIGTSLASSAWAGALVLVPFVRDRELDGRLVGLLSLGAVVGLPIGLGLVRYLPEVPTVLGLALALLVGAGLAWSPERLPISARSDDRARVALGLVAGLATGLLGVAGGLVLVLAQRAWLRIPYPRAVAQAVAVIVAAGAPRMASYVLAGEVDGGAAFVLDLGVLPGVLLGYEALKRASAPQLQHRLAVMMALMAFGLTWSVAAPALRGAPDQASATARPPAPVSELPQAGSEQLVFGGTANQADTALDLQRIGGFENTKAGEPWRIKVGFEVEWASKSPVMVRNLMFIGWGAPARSGQRFELTPGGTNDPQPTEPGHEHARAVLCMREGPSADPLHAAKAWFATAGSLELARVDGQVVDVIVHHTILEPRRPDGFAIGFDGPNQATGILTVDGSARCKDFLYYRP